MSTATVDAKKRVVIACGKPGEVYDVQRQDEGIVLLVRLEPTQPSTPVDRQACLDAMRRCPLHPRLSWEQLRLLTREP